MTTIDLTQITNDAIAKAVESGALKAAIERGVSKAVEDIARSATGYGSPLREALEDAVKGALQLQPGAMGLPSYNAAILDVIKSKLDAIMDEQLRERFSKDLDDLLVQAPKEITISKLVENFKRWAIEDHLADGEYCSVCIKRTEYGSHWVYLDPSRGKDNYTARFKFLINQDDEVFSFTDSGHDMKNAILSKCLRGFPRDLFRIMVAGTKVVIDTTDISNSLIDLDEEGDI